MKYYFLHFCFLFAATALFANTITVTSKNDSGAGTLRNAIAAATSGDVIVFDAALANQTITLATTLSIPVAKNLTVDGSAAVSLTISGNNAVRIFLLGSTSVNPTSLTLKSLNLINGLATDNGAAVLTQHQGILNISNCNFIGNNSAEGGSAVYSNFEGKATILNCTFSDNICISGNNESGSTVFLFGPNIQIVKNCTFKNNKGINGGAIHGINAPLLIEDCNFTGNVTTDARFDTGQPQDFLRGYGGAIYTDRATTDPSNTTGSIILRRCKFEGNTGRGEGGAAYLYTGEKDNVLVEYCDFNNNKVLGLTGSGNINSSDGGAITQMNASNTKNKGTILANSTFSNNTSINGGGAVRIRNADTKIENCTFYKNSSTFVSANGYNSNGGAVYLDHDNSITTINEITHCTFAENSAGWVGGAILGDKSIKIKNNIFSNNTTYTFGNNGYSIALHTSNEMTDLGGNLQFPVQPHPGDANDCNVSASVTIADANLLPLANNGGFSPTMALQAGSPAINFGAGCTLPLDQRGVSRTGTCDAGAFEFSGTLPVSIVNFTAKPAGNSAKIEWTTATELNSTHFEIKKSTDGVIFVKLVDIPAKGSQTGLTRYIAYDDNPALGTNFYKLICYNADGSSTEEGIKTLQFNSNTPGKLVIYANPTSDGTITVVMPKEFLGLEKHVNIIDALGKEILRVKVVETVQTYTLNIPGNLKGIFFLSVAAGKIKYTSKIISN